MNTKRKMLVLSFTLPLVLILGYYVGSYLYNYMETKQKTNFPNSLNKSYQLLLPNKPPAHIAGGKTDVTKQTNIVGGKPPYYEGHDNQIEPNPNK